MTISPKLYSIRGLEISLFFWYTQDDEVGCRYRTSTGNHNSNQQSTTIMKHLKSLLFLMAVCSFAGFVSAAEPTANNPNAYQGTDSERIAQAVKAAPKNGGVVRIPARQPDAVSPRTFWLLDSAILLPGNTTLLLENCTLKLSDRCRDNFIRSANAGPGIEKVPYCKNIHIVGIGQVELLGADNPRATGDGAKQLGVRSYGTDTGKKGESQTGDWRNIGLLLAYVENFSIINITMRQAHCWGMSLEHCSFGKVTDIIFESTENRIINGKAVKTLNQDGLDLRKGCHDIVIENIRGRTGDDLVALTAIRHSAKKGGTFDSTEVGQTDPDDLNDIYNVTIRNVVGHAAGGHQIVRFLNASGIKIHHIILDGVIDTSPETVTDFATIRIGDQNPSWGGVTPLGDTYGFIITNIHSRSKQAVLIAGSLTDSIITNIVNYNKDISGVCFQSGKQNVRNVRIDDFVNAQPLPVKSGEPKKR